MSEKQLTLNVTALRSTKLRGRDCELKMIELSLQSGSNAYIFGPLGTGKTTAVKKAIERYGGRRGNAIYIDACVFRTEHSILQEVIDHINADHTPKILIHARSNPDIVKRLRKDKERYPELKFVVLDNFERIAEPQTVYDLLFIGFKLVLVSNDRKALGKLTQLPDSSFANVIEFKEYSLAQVVAILTDKAEELVGAESCEHSVLEKIAGLCHGNIGYGVEILLASIMMAASRNKERVEDSDVPDFQRTVAADNDDETLLQILKEKGKLGAGELYRAYVDRAKSARSARAFRYRMENLVHRGLVKASGGTSNRVYEFAE